MHSIHCETECPSACTDSTSSRRMAGELRRRYWTNRPACRGPMPGNFSKRAVNFYGVQHTVVGVIVVLNVLIVNATRTNKTSLRLERRAVDFDSRLLLEIAKVALFDGAERGFFLVEEEVDLARRTVAMFLDKN